MKDDCGVCCMALSNPLAGTFGKQVIQRHAREYARPVQFH